MKTSEKGIELIKQFEGCRLTAYRCPEGKLTIGYGHTAGVQEGQTITQEQADAHLKADLEKFEKLVEKYDKKYAWKQNQFDALVSFAFNIGNIDQLTAKGSRTKAEIASAMLLYNKIDKRASAGLSLRRQKERALFVTREERGIVAFSLRADGEQQISRNFKVKEFQCKDRSDKILIDVDFVDMLQEIRGHFGVPVTINSAYRTEGYNVKVGGAKASYHVKGQAFDIVVKGHTPLEVAQYAQRMGINGIIQYNRFVHVDSRTTRYWARNNNGKVTVKSSF